MKVTCCLSRNSNSAFLSISGSVKHAMLRWLALHVHNILVVDQGGYWNRFNGARIRPRKKYVLKDRWFTLALTDMKMEKFFKCLFKQNLTTWNTKMCFETIIMFYFFKWSISLNLLLYMYSITNLFYWPYIKFVSGILGIKACSIEIIKEL